MAAVTIGAAPRPDLTDALRAAIGGVDVIEVGALDDLPLDVSPPAPAGDGYPLVTRRHDGRTLTADEAWLAPLVADAVRRAEIDGATVIVLLCAGGFASVAAAAPLVRPFDVAVARLRTLGANRLGIIVPIGAQVAPSQAKWMAEGFEPTIEVGAPRDVIRFDGHGDAGRRAGRVDAIVLDYVGHAARVVSEAETLASPIPVIDLLAASIEAVVARMRA